MRYVLAKTYVKKSPWNKCDFVYMKWSEATANIEKFDSMSDREVIMEALKMPEILELLANYFVVERRETTTPPVVSPLSSGN